MAQKEGTAHTDSIREWCTAELGERDSCCQRLSLPFLRGVEKSLARGGQWDTDLYFRRSFKGKSTDRLREVFYSHHSWVIVTINVEIFQIPIITYNVNTCVLECCGFSPDPHKTVVNVSPNEDVDCGRSLKKMPCCPQSWNNVVSSLNSCLYISVITFDQEHFKKINTFSIRNKLHWLDHFIRRDILLSVNKYLQ